MNPSEENPQPTTGHRDSAAASVVQVQRVYGRRHALTIEATRTRRDEPTLSFEFASAIEEGSPGAGQSYNWDDKLIIQLKTDHLPLYAAALLGDLPRLRRDHYGQPPNKSFECMTDHRGVVAIKGMAPERGHAVPVSGGRLFWLITQALGRIGEASGGLMDPISARAVIRRAAEMHGQQKGAGQPNNTAGVSRG